MDEADPRYADLERIFKHDENALSFFSDWIALTEVWDDLVDRDRPVPKDRINEAFWTALVGLPANPVYVEHGATLRAAMASAILAWIDSNEMRENPVGAEDALTAHVVRYQVVDIAILLLVQRFGWKYASEHAPAIRRMFRCESLTEFLEN